MTGERPPAPRRDRDTPTQLAAPAAAQQMRGQTIAGKYSLVRLVAQGGMGAVWEAVDTQLERSVAIKFMSPAIAHDPHARQRFNREAKAAARLHTPHVVRIFEHGLDGESPFIVMELLQGRDLHSRLKQERRIPLEDAARIVAQIAKGLRAAHEANIVHRDLKPQNIFLANVDGDLVVKILDFGVAKMNDKASEATKTGVLLGSPHYMSPEQARGKSNIDHRSDVWSLAVIAFRMITGRMAFNGEGQGDVIIAIATSPIPVPSQVRSDLGAEIDAFMARGLMREREERYATAIDLATAFAAAVRAHTDASLLTPAAGHPLHPGVAHAMETTQVLHDQAPPVLPPPPAPPRAPFISQPSQPRMPLPSQGTPMPMTPRSSQPGIYASSSGLGTPHSQSPAVQTLHTPATGPSVGIGNAIFSAPPEPRSERRVIGIVIGVTVALASVAMLAALGTGAAETTAQSPAVPATAAPATAAPATPSTAQPAATANVVPTTTATVSAPLPSATVTASAVPSTAQPKFRAPKAKPKSKSGWDDFGY